MRFAIHISTKNRKHDLLFTLEKIAHLLTKAECVVFDDGSDDGTSEAVTANFPQVTLLRNEASRGYLYCRNKMLNDSRADVAISLDDDAHFLSQDTLAEIENHFNRHEECGVIAFRIYWGKTTPENLDADEKSARVKGFVGCGHAWRISAWKSIPDYPEWFRFYGEETFASLQLFKKKMEVHYLPSVLVQHRVDMKARKNSTDFKKRFRNSLRADWYLFFLFYPFDMASKKFTYSVWKQLSTKVFQGQPGLFMPLMLAMKDVIANMPQINKYKNTLTSEEYLQYRSLPETRIFWKPQDGE